MATSAAADQIVEVVTPAAGESVSEGTILEWHAKVGDFIKAADTIVEISTDKVDVELPEAATRRAGERARSAAHGRARARRCPRGERKRAAGFRRGPAAGRARARRCPRGERQRTAGARAGAPGGRRRSGWEGLAGRGARGRSRGGRPRPGVR